MLQLCRDRGEPRASGLLQRDGSDPASAAASLDDVVRERCSQIIGNIGAFNGPVPRRSQRAALAVRPIIVSGFFFLLTTVGDDQRTFFHTRRPSFARRRALTLPTLASRTFLDKLIL